jgi:hypothetical protein
MHIFVDLVLLFCYSDIRLDKNKSIMTFARQEFIESLKQLNLSAIEAAKLLSVTPRTVNRWVDNPEEISGPAEQAIRAWMRLHNYNLPWRPDAIPIAEDDPDFPEQISMLRNESILLDSILQKVQKKGGSTLPWHINLQKGIARLETIEVNFYTMHNGSFSPAMYRRTDKSLLNLDSDRDILEDAIFCVHQALSREQSSKQEKI